MREITRVDSHVRDSETIAAVDANSLDGGVVDVKIGDGRVGQVMSVEELGLGLAAVGTFAVPPARSIRVQVGAAGALDGDAFTGNLEEGAGPFLVSPGGLALEDDLWLRKLALHAIVERWERINCLQWCHQRAS